MQYDEGWIIAFAKALESKAKTLVRNAYILSVLISAAVLAALTATNQLPIIPAVLATIVAFSVFAGIFVSRARSEAAILLLQAHTALCQVQIERNTRPQ